MRYRQTLLKHTHIADNSANSRSGLASLYN